MHSVSKEHEDDYFDVVFRMSAIPPKADIHRNDWNVCFVPKADICTAANRRAIGNDFQVDCSSTDSRNVWDGQKNRVPVTARLKSSSRS